MRHSRVALLTVLIVALLAVAACTTTSPTATSPTGAATAPATTSPSGTATASAKTAACNGLATVNQALTSVAGLNANTTVGEVKAAQVKVTNALNAIDALIPSASGDLLNQVKSANEQVAAAIQPYPDSTPIGQTSAKVQDLKAAVANAQTKTTQLASTLQCPP